MGQGVAASLEYFAKHGGHCDCEVLMNVDEVTDLGRRRGQATRYGCGRFVAGKPRQFNGCGWRSKACLMALVSGASDANQPH